MRACAQKKREKHAIEDGAPGRRRLRCHFLIEDSCGRQAMDISLLGMDKFWRKMQELEVEQSISR